MNNAYTWYQALIKPHWAPPSWIFGPVWSVLYTIIGITFSMIFYKAFTKQIPWTVALPCALNLVFNALFTPIQFGLKNNYLATLDILLVFFTLVWMGIALWPYTRSVVYANVPYFLWVSFATILQITITYLNRK